MKTLKIVSCLLMSIVLISSAFAENLDHRVMVKELLQTDSYTYVHYVENNEESWFATDFTEDIKVGDTLEFPDSPPMLNFKAIALNKAFPKIIFATGWRKVDLKKQPESTIPKKQEGKSP